MKVSLLFVMILVNENFYCLDVGKSVDTETEFLCVSIGQVYTLNVIMHSNISPNKLPFTTMQGSPINVEVRGQ
jgi:hypothetical protein